MREHEDDLSSRRSGTWTHEQLAEMNRNALVRMAVCHPNLAPPYLKALIQKLRQKKQDKTAQQILTDLFDAIPEGEGEGEKDSETAAVERMQVNTARAIRKAVAQRHFLTVEDLDSSCHSKVLVKARHEAMYLVARECPLLSYPRLGKMFGGKDHTTIMTAVRNYAYRNGLPFARGPNPPEVFVAT